MTDTALSGTLDYMNVYIDANLYDHIEKGPDQVPPQHRIPTEHCAAFRDARLSGLSAYLSLPDVEELLGDSKKPERRPAGPRRKRDRP